MSIKNIQSGEIESNDYNNNIITAIQHNHFFNMAKS